MFCKNCGQEIDDLAAVCIHCGVAVGNGVKFCQNCGSELPEEAAFCIKCGVSTKGKTNGCINNNANVNAGNAPVTDPNAKSRLAAGLLGIFVGALGIHNFYLGYNGKAVAQLLMTVLSCGILSVASSIWGLIEGIFYLVEKEGYTTDAKGNPLGE